MSFKETVQAIVRSSGNTTTPIAYESDATIDQRKRLCRACREFASLSVQKKEAPIQTVSIQELREDRAVFQERIEQIDTVIESLEAA